MRALTTSFVATALLVSACQQEPRSVYVPQVPPEVQVSVHATITAKVGESVLLHGQRSYRGAWTQVDRASLSPEHCWVTSPPPEHEPEVADNLHWEVTPFSTARFNIGLRPDRAREVVFSQPGTYVLQATSAVWCGPAKGVRSNSITITVHAAR
jgi:hypothetical protein